MNYIKYIKTTLYLLTTIFLLSIIISSLNYFNLIKMDSIVYFKLFSLIMSLFIVGIYIGNKADKKGYLEGIKISILFIIISLITNYVVLKNTLSLRILLFYIICIISTVLGSIIGINKHTKKNT